MKNWNCNQLFKLLKTVSTHFSYLSFQEKFCFHFGQKEKNSKLDLIPRVFKDSLEKTLSTSSLIRPSYPSSATVFFPWKIFNIPYFPAQRRKKNIANFHMGKQWLCIRYSTQRSDTGTTHLYGKEIFISLQQFTAPFLYLMPFL